MDVQAVAHATDDIREDLGLIKTSDKVSLKAFCQPNPGADEPGESKDSKKGDFWKHFLAEKRKGGNLLRRLFLPIQ